MKIETALLSVSDKTGIVEFAQELAKRGVRLLSTGGTAKLLAQAGLNVPSASMNRAFEAPREGRDSNTLRNSSEDAFFACR